MQLTRNYDDRRFGPGLTVVVFFLSISLTVFFFFFVFDGLFLLLFRSFKNQFRTAESCDRL